MSAATMHAVRIGVDGRPEVNLMATAIARAHGAIWQPFCGVVAFGGPRRQRSHGGSV